MEATCLVLGLGRFVGNEGAGRRVTIAVVL